MVKRIAAGFAISFFLTGVVLADFGQTVADFRLQFETYTKAQKDYQTAKSAFLQFKTLPAETEAFGKMKQVLAERAKLMDAYFKILAEKLNQISQSNNSKNQIISEIEVERVYFTQFIQGTQNVKNTQEAENLSSEFEGRKETWQNLATKTKGIIFSLQLLKLAEKTNEQITRIETNLNQNQVADYTLREEKLNFAKANIAEAKKLIVSSQNAFSQIRLSSPKSEMMRNETAGKADFTKAKTLLEQAVLLIKETARGF